MAPAVPTLPGIPVSVLVGGLEQTRHGFSHLPHVGKELAQIQSEVQSRVLLNQQFTTQAFQTNMDSQSGVAEREYEIEAV